MDVYLVWSHAAGKWWRANAAGYTHDLWDAGRYDQAAALSAIGLRTWSVGAPPPEVMVLAPESGGQDAFTVEQIRAMPGVMRQRIDEATERRIAQRDLLHAAGRGGT